MNLNACCLGKQIRKTWLLSLITRYVLCLHSNRRVEADCQRLTNRFLYFPVWTLRGGHLGCRSPWVLGTLQLAKANLHASSELRQSVCFVFRPGRSAINPVDFKVVLVMQGR
jgi:hypothetical protein